MARSVSDEAIQPIWIASRSLSSDGAFPLTRWLVMT
jgi:hypothetical protein